MKKLLFSALILAGFSTATLAQTAPAAKKENAAKMQVVKKTNDKKEAAKVVDMNKATKPAAATTAPAAVKTEAKKEAVKTTAPAGTGPLKKDGTPDRRYKANQGTASGPLKKDGTPDMRYKANKKKS